MLYDDIYTFIEETHKFNVDGLINFRVLKYKSYLKNLIEKEVHNHVVEKEYSEYVALLKDYLDFQSAETDVIHLIYTNKEKVLLDKYGNVVTTTASKKYLSDISFSSNEIILNSLISLPPQKLIIHQHSEDDDFIGFLKKIFEGKYTLCNKCDICSRFFKDSDKITTNT